MFRRKSNKLDDEAIQATVPDNHIAVVLNQGQRRLITTGPAFTCYPGKGESYLLFDLRRQYRGLTIALETMDSHKIVLDLGFIFRIINLELFLDTSSAPLQDIEDLIKSLLTRKLLNRDRVQAVLDIETILFDINLKVQTQASKYGLEGEILEANLIAKADLERSQAGAPKRSEGKRGDHRVNLSRKMSDCFSVGDVEDICFELDVDFESIRGDQKTSKIRELILFCERNGCLEKLIEKCREKRPNIDWKE